MKKVLLYSGGMDSYLISKVWNPDVKLYINIHGDYSSDEIKKLPKDVKVVDFPLLGNFELPNKFVPLRNMYFLMIASNFGDEICLGAMAGDWGNNDKTPKFLDDSEALLQYLWADKKVKKSIKISKEFIHLSKSELLKKYIESGKDVNKIREETFSCYTPVGGKECFNCYPCFRKFALLYANGCNYTKEERHKMWEYVKKNIIPTKEQGGYPGTYYTDRGIESQDLIKAVNLLKGEFDEQN